MRELDFCTAPAAAPAVSASLKLSTGASGQARHSGTVAPTSHAQGFTAAAALLRNLLTIVQTQAERPAEARAKLMRVARARMPPLQESVDRGGCYPKWHLLRISGTPISGRVGDSSRNMVAMRAATHFPRTVDGWRTRHL